MIKLPDEKAFQAFNNDIDCPLAGVTTKVAARKAWQAAIAEVQRLNATAQPVSEQHAKIANSLESLLWPNMASGNKEIINAAIRALRATSGQPVRDGCKEQEGK